MTFRDRVEAVFQNDSRSLWLVWAGTPLLAAILPGPGVLLSGFLVIVFLWLGRQPWSSVGLRRPANISALFLVALGLASLVWLGAEYVVDPIAKQIAGTDLDLGQFADLKGNWQKFLLWMALSWAVGGFLEELVFRGFLIEYGVRLFGERSVWPLAALGSIVFGVSHLYQGHAGVIATGVIGFLFATIFILSRRNLLLVMLVHGLVDTVYFSLAFLGVKALA